MEKLFSPGDSYELLRGWSIHAKKEQKKHEEAARRLESRYRQIGVASVILSAIVGASIFAALEAAYEPWSRIVAGIISILASVLSSLITFHRYEERTEKHRSAGVRYKATLRRLEQVLTPPANSNISQGIIEEIRKELNELEAYVPVVPEDINRVFEERYQDYRFVTKAEELRREHEDLG
jgi:hypothetical protein